MKHLSKLFFVGWIAFQFAGGGWLGVLVQDVTPQIARRYGLRVNEGVLITRVRFNSPAMSGGVKEGDVVISLNGEKIPDSRSLQKVVSSLDPEKQIELVVLRHRREKRLKIVLGSIPRSSA